MNKIAWAIFGVFCTMAISAATTYLIDYDEHRIKQGLSVVSAFGIGALMFTEEEQTEDKKPGITSFGLWLGAVMVICFCYTMRVIDDNSDGVGLSVAVILNFVFDCAISKTPRWIIATGADNVALVTVLAARAHKETFKLKWMYVVFPPIVYAIIAFFVSYKQYLQAYFNTNGSKTFVQTVITGAKQGIVAYTIAIELASHVIDTIDDHAITYGALCALSVAGPLTNWIAGRPKRATSSAHVIPVVQMPPRADAVLY